MKNRDALAKEVIEQLGSNDLVFGSYVRDQLAGLQFTDMDVFLHSNYDDPEGNLARRNFLWKLKGDKFRYEIIEYAYEVLHGTCKLYKQSFRVSYKDSVSPWLDVNLFTNEQNDPFVSSDADINSLYLKDGKLHAARGFNLEKVKANIDSKVFEAPEGMTQDQILDLQNKGFFQSCVDKGKKEEVTCMKTGSSTKAGVFETIKQDGNKALYRIAGTQITKGTRAGAVKVLKSKGFKASQIKAITELMETEIGRGLFSGLLGVALPYIPTVGADPRAQKLASEFRIEGMATIGNEVVEELKGLLMPVFFEAFSTLPPVTLDEVIEETEKRARQSATEVVEQAKTTSSKTA